MHITNTQIENLIDKKYVGRGKPYFKDRLVELTSVTHTNVTAKCVGTRIYSITLVQDNGALSGECSCPAFEDYGPCKHMAAVAFAVMAYETSGYTPSRDYYSLTKRYKHIEQLLMKKSKAELIAILMHVLQDDPDLQWMIEEDIDDDAW